MSQNARDLVKAGGYILGVGVLLASVALAGASALRELPNAPVFNWMAELIEPASTQETRLSQALINSREIKAALAKPIPRPEPLPPITAKLTYGHLRPGGSGRPRKTSSGRNSQKQRWSQMQWLIKQTISVRAAPSFPSFIECTSAV